MKRLLALLLAAACGTSLASTAPSLSPQEKACFKFAGRLGSVYDSDCDRKPFRSSGHYSVNGEPILLRDFAPTHRLEPRARVLLIGGIHGDELSSVSIIFSWIRMLEDEADSSPYHWRITPSMNPDGVLKRHAQRTNANGVDLNRNFPTPNWEKETEHYWVERTRRNPRRYPGPAPLSEPESRWLHQEIARFQPHAIVAVHAPIGIVDFDGPAQPPHRLGKLRLNLLGTYPGSLGNYAGVHRGIPVLTVELASAGIMPSDREQQEMWQDLNRWLHQHIPTREQRAATRLTTTP